MCKGTEIAEFTRLHIGRPSVTEFCFVLLRMIERLNTIVAFSACRAVRALSALRILTYHRRVCTQWTSLILVMIIETLFGIVTIFFHTWLSFEESQVEESHTFPLFSAKCRLL